MDFNIDLGKVPNIKLVTIIISIFSSLLAPYWFLYQFNKPLFEHTDLLNLLLLCLCIGFPLTFFNILQSLIANLGNNMKDQKDFGYFIVILGASTTIASFYVPLIWTFHNKVTLKEAIRSIQFVEMGISASVALKLLANWLIPLIWPKKKVIAPSDPIPVPLSSESITPVERTEQNQQ